ncbi:DUF1631 domain-containing protein [Thermochromatium tepidum]|uniref:DUF1631 family protein n=1 Tax=Thermochromatium tepidum ATCC 43061 TaxID=316276 RepID=A0A6I6E1I2_THETI|nr:DUF1631 domain-containing protein [Thermochromatium tepidum]QGU33744.1 DUF1631 family protein [Thermochromatium tepidum ATCC 43061]
MIKQPNSNVIPFGAREASSPDVRRAETVSILETCRERLIDTVLAVFTRHVGRANDELFDMMDQAVDQGLRQLCFDAVSLLANRTPLLLQRFRAAYVERFNEAIECLGRPDAPMPTRVPEELKLVDEEDFEVDLALSKLTTRASFNCAQPLLALDRRLAVLLNGARITPEDNPLHPITLYRALFQALTSLDASRELAIFLMQVFERQTSAELPEIYNEINRYLIESGILPKIPLSGPQTTAVQSNLAGSTSAPRGPATDTAMSSGPPLPPADIFARLVSLLQPPPGYPVLPPTVAGSAVSAAVADSTLTPFEHERLMQTLSSLQRGPLIPGAAPGLGMAPLDPWASNAIAQLRATPMAKGSPRLDAMTIDIVAMLFEAIFDDPDLPAAVRAEIAKLQIPVLKVALLDKGFFSDRQHPARRLLDLIAQAGLGRGEDEQPRFLDMIRSVVTSVIEGFESDIGILAEQVQRLEAFLAEEETQSRDRAVGLVAGLARRERQDLAATHVAAEVQRRVTRPGVPGLIVEFLERGWSQVLSEIFVRQGPTDAEWTQAIQLMDDLIWSLEPKIHPADRERFIGLLPRLIQGLRSGLARLGQEAAWSEFFNVLIQRHVAALRGEGAVTSEVASSPSSTARPTPEPTVTPPSRPTPPGRPGTLPDDDPHLKLVRALEPGAWIEFQTERGTRHTLRLNWVSEFKGVYLFTNRQGENAMTLAAASLAAHLRKGTARLLSQNPLTERAVTRLMERVQSPVAAPGA